jgi:methyl-accepting chemotaxis protein
VVLKLCGIFGVKTMNIIKKLTPSFIRKSMKRKLFFAITIIFVGGFIASKIVSWVVFEVFQKKSYFEYFRGIEKLFYYYLNNTSSHLVMIAKAIASNPTIRETIKTEDREALYENIKELYMEYQNVLGSKIKIHFYLPPAISFLRVHKPNIYGDDLSKIKRMIVIATKTSHFVKGLDIGKSEIGIRGAVPVKENGKVIAVIEVGLSLKPIIKSFRNYFGLEVAILLNKNYPPIKKLFAHTKKKMVSESLFLYQATDYSLINKLYQEREIKIEKGKFNIMKLGGYIIHYFPLKNFSGKNIGYVGVYKDTKAHTNLLEQVVLLESIAGLIITIILIPLINLLLKHEISAIEEIAERIDPKKVYNIGGSIEIGEREDEIAHLVNNFNSFLDGLRVVIEIISEIGSTNLESSKRLKKDAEDFMKSSQEITANVEELHANMEEIQSAIEVIQKVAIQYEKVAKKSENDFKNLLDRILSIVKEAETVTTMAERVFSELERGKDAVNEGIEYIDKIAKGYEQIKEIADVINEISDRINMLSLNAAIEAARAGEYGRGFAVVSQEISKLADATSKSADEVSGIVEKNVEVGREGVEKIQNVSSTIKDVLEDVNKTFEIVKNIGNIILEIKGNIQLFSEIIMQNKEMANKIRVSVEEINQALKEVGNMGEFLLQMAQIITTASEDLYRSSDLLVSRAELLNQLVQKFES